MAPPSAAGISRRSGASATVSSLVVSGFGGAVRYRVAFYGSTPAYRPVLELHGLGDLGTRLSTLARAQQWDSMAPLISDETLRLFVAMGTYDELPAAIQETSGGIADIVTLPLPPEAPANLKRELIEQIQRLPCQFQQFRAM